MTARAVYRYEVPVDDQWHAIQMTWAAAPLAVECRDGAVVEFWAESNPPQVERAFRVFGTGQPLPKDAAIYVGTAVAPGGALVWHLYERAW